MPAAVNFNILVNGEAVQDDHFVAFTVDRDIFQPDMCTVVLNNQGSFYSSKRKIAESIEIQVGSSNETIYKGEIVGIEPTFKGGGKTTILIRGMNKLHLLLRKRKSITFQDKTDQAILSQVVGDAGLSLDWKHDKSITYKNVYQHNQTDLEFLRMRAARLGAHIWCVDSKVSVKWPDLGNDSGIVLSLDPSQDGVGLHAFTPRMSSAPIVKKVTVKGWNPETKELISATASAKSSPLGGKNASSGSNAHGTEETFTVDHPIWSQEEAQALADGRLMDLSLSYITGEAETVGSPKFDLGKVVKITAGPGDFFNGKYYVMGITHRHSAGSKDGFITILRLARDAQE
jgi:phage protein D